MLKKLTIKLLDSLSNLLLKIEGSDYSREINVLDKSSIGNHIRHIIDFYSRLLNPVENKTICYDERERKELIETNKGTALKKLTDIKNAISTSDLDDELVLNQTICNYKANIKTTVERELLYSFEHTVHDIEIIRIAINTAFSNISLEPSFGVAIAHLKKWFEK